MCTHIMHAIGGWARRYLSTLSIKLIPDTTLQSRFASKERASRLINKVSVRPNQPEGSVLPRWIRNRIHYTVHYIFRASMKCSDMDM